ncbi:lamin tail domain-containing protein [Chryseobacterium sp. PBS4-4]|uniref:Lamin tail domain-containing protein n=1 Tax=Chryseobacterium edaphi TaxID=2976532 RepID=A0ABT2W7D2_9FLAO|nr:lamin tail domain-containing protein [Chryseobacterium edaphi]MCU7618106.1 lamin tail domain-containing protein [Chryseobacterium edaphi]
MKKIFTILGMIGVYAFANAQIVINEVYGGGGNSGSTYTNDFIELKNIGSTTVTLANATIQYASATGTFNQYHTLPTITLTAGQTYLIQEAAGTGGTTALPTPNFTATTVVNFDGSTNNNVGLALAAAAGKVVLANNSVQVTAPTNTNVVDFVGFGTTANQYEGSTGPAAAPSASNSTARISGDTNNNANDFAAGAPTPQPTGGSLAISDFNKSNSNFIKNTFIKNEEITFGADVKDVKIYTLTGQVVKTASVKDGAALNVAELAKGNYIVTGTVNNQPVSQKILKD